MGTAARGGGPGRGRGGGGDRRTEGARGGGGAVECRNAARWPGGRRAARGAPHGSLAARAGPAGEGRERNVVLVIWESMSWLRTGVGYWDILPADTWHLRLPPILMT